MYDADIRASDEAAKGARSWEAPELGTGLWMTPYNPSLWKRNADGTPGMGQYMISAQQMIPNKKELDAKRKLPPRGLRRRQRVKTSQTQRAVCRRQNELLHLAHRRKKITVLDDNEKLLSFMIQSTEIRYKNNLGNLNAYYKAKAALGDIQNQRIQLAKRDHPTTGPAQHPDEQAEPNPLSASTPPIPLKDLQPLSTTAATFCKPAAI